MEPILERSNVPTLLATSNPKRTYTRAHAHVRAHAHKHKHTHTLTLTLTHVPADAGLHKENVLALYRRESRAASAALLAECTRQRALLTRRLQARRDAAAARTAAMAAAAAPAAGRSSVEQPEGGRAVGDGGGRGDGHGAEKAEQETDYRHIAVRRTTSAKADQETDYDREEGAGGASLVL